MAKLGIKKLLKQLGEELECRPAKPAERVEPPWPMPGPVPMRGGEELRVVRMRSAEAPAAPRPVLEVKPGEPPVPPEKEERAEAEKPLVLEFPKVTESLLAKTLPLIERETGEVRGLPTPLYTIPHEVRGVKIPSEWEPVSPATINVRYPLIEPYSYAAITWDEKNQALTYTVMEPPLTRAEASKLDLIKELIVDLLDINLMAVRDVATVQKYLQEKLNQIIIDYGIDMTKSEYEKIMYYVNRNFLGLGPIEPMMQDMQIEDISCDGVGINLFVFHRKYASVKTNIVFNDAEELNKFVTKLAQRCGKHISVAEPLMDGALPDGSIDYNEFVIFKENGEIKIDKIGALVDKFYGEASSNVPVKVNNLEIPTFDPETMKMCWKPVTYVYRHKWDKPLYGLKMETGRSIRLTGSHSIFALKEGKLLSVPTSEIKVGDYLAIPLTIPNPVKRTLKINLAESLSKLSKRFWLSNVPLHVYERKRQKIMEYLTVHYKNPKASFCGLRIKKILPLHLYTALSKKDLELCKIKFCAVEVPIFLKKTKELFRLLGYYCAEGWLGKQRNRISFSFGKNRKEKKLIRDVQKCFEKCFSISTYVENREKETKIHAESAILFIIFKDVLCVRKGAKRKEVPQIVFNAPSSLQKEFLKAWWAGDYGYSASKKMVSDILYLCLLLDKVASIQERTKVAFFDDRRVASKAYCTQRLLERKSIRCPSMIPVDQFRMVRSMHHLFENTRISRPRMLKIMREARFGVLEGVQNISEKVLSEWENRGLIFRTPNPGFKLSDKGSKALEELSTIEKMVDGDIGFVKVLHIEEAAASSDFVYDLSVEGNENFIGGIGGLFCHNSRIQATFSAGKDIATKGSTFTIRKFTKDPLTIVDLMNFGTIPAFMGAYFWLAMEFRNSILVSGGTASGKTSCLNVLCMFLPPELKVVSIEDTPELALPHEHWVAKIARTGYGPEVGERRRGEITMFDLLKAALRERPEELIVGEVRGKEAYVLFQGMASVRGSEPVFLLDEKGKAWFDSIEKLYGKDLRGWEAVTVNPWTKKVETRPVAACVRHAPRSELFEIKTVTGRRVVTTGDHSVFTIEDGTVVPKTVQGLKEEDCIAVVSRLPSGFAEVEWLNLVELLPHARVVAPFFISQAVEKLGWEAANVVCGLRSISDYYAKKNVSALKVPLYLKLLREAGVYNNLDEVRIKFDRTSKSFPAKLILTPELLRLIGYYLSEGSLNTAAKNNSIALYNKDKRVLEDTCKCILAVTGKMPSERQTRGWGACTELRFNHKVLFELLRTHCGHGRNRRIPHFVFGLSKEKIGWLLSALYEGDGSINERSVQYSTTSHSLAQGVLGLLSCLGIVAHVYESKPSSVRSKKNVFRIEFYSKGEKEAFLKYAKPLTKGAELKMKARPERSRRLEDLYADRVKSVRRISLERPEYVYDLSVPGTQNFVGGFGGVMLHNTGHAGLATLHAESVDAIVNRLVTPPISLSPGLLQHLNVVVIMVNARVKGQEVRRVKEVVEIVGMDPKTEKPIVNTIFRWVSAGDYYEFASDKSYVFNKIVETKGVSEKSVWEELHRRTAILNWLRKQGIRYYKDVGSLIAFYYKNPDEVLKRVYGS